MAYTKQTWHDEPTEDTPLSAARLGHLEDGVEAASAAADAAVQRTNHTGSQTSSTISDFTEAVQDAVAALLGAGTNITVSYNDAANTLTIGTTGADPEAVRDIIGVALLGVGNISVSVNDALDTITISTAATVNATDAALRDRTTHTGVQAISTVTGLQSALDALTAAVAAASATSQPLDSDLTTIAALDASTAGVLSTDGAGWIRKTYAQLKTALGLNNVDNTSDANKPVSTAQQTALDAKMAALTVTAVKTANYTLAANEAARFDTTSGSLTGTLPTAPADKTLALVKNVIQGGTNTVTIACGGSDTLNRVGGATTYVLPLLAQGAMLQYRAADSTWTIIADDLALSQLDARYALLSTVTTKGDLLAATAAGVLARLGVGSNNSVLTADSTATTGLKWAAAAGGSSVPFFKTTSGQYFATPEAAAGGSANVGVGYLCATPIIIPADVTVTSIGVNVTSATASSLVRLGIYNDDGTMRAGTLLLDAGTVSGATTGFKEITISQALTAGIYWLAAVQQTAACSLTGSLPVMPIPAPSATVASSKSYGLANNGGTTGALPGTFGAVTFYGSSGAPYPRVILKAA